MNSTEIRDYIKRFRAVKSPLLGYNTYNPIPSINFLDKLLEEIDQELYDDEAPIIHIVWDAVQGFTGEGELGCSWVEQNKPKGFPNFLDDLRLVMDKLPAFGVAIFQESDKFLSPENCQPEILAKTVSLMNLLERALPDKNRLILFLGYKIILPSDLRQVIFTIDEDYPSDQELKEILSKSYEYTEGQIQQPLVDDVWKKEITSLKGLTRIGAEHVSLLSLRKDIGLDLNSVRKLKSSLIDGVRGLSICNSVDSLDDIAGLENIKDLLKMVFSSPNSPKGIVLIDELDKSLSVDDLSGVGKYILKQWLQAFEKFNMDGILTLGPPGVAKTYIGECAGVSFREKGIISVDCDLNGVKDKFVGSSEENVRAQLDAIHGLFGKDILVIASCNHLEDIPDNLQSRFALGTFFFDIPTYKERLGIWFIHLRKNQLISLEDYNMFSRSSLEDKANFLNGLLGNSIVDFPYSGRDIRNICRNVKKYKFSFDKAVSYITPVSITKAKEINAMRSFATNRLLSASYAGLYQMPKEDSLKSISDIQNNLNIKTNENTILN